ncbi:prepilin peptidase [Kibdelosporangium philippinense]|uniref:Prepilin peptidase n=2 Tax=Kibdelosporangium philippinense TaxID=211113 RepID=A0ABS8ZVH1_9PSEU|nr:prepilin peptidase [Kibdelosporangium philippinense]MCE7011735.1 prepilin peptidase [Kibdelosporangium philippinense]
MNAASIAGWGLVGLLIGGGLRMFVERVVALPALTKRVAPPAVLEVVTALLFAALAWRSGAKAELFAYSWLAAISVPLAAIDWRTRQLPTRLIWPGGLVLIAIFGMAAAVNRDTYPLIRSFAGMLALLAFYGAIYFLRPGELGGGDLRLGGLLGLALGWIGWIAVLTGTLLGWLAAAIAVIALRAVRRTGTGRRDVPLGPFLVIGTFVTVLAIPPV